MPESDHSGAYSHHGKKRPPVPLQLRGDDEQGHGERHGAPGAQCEADRRGAEEKREAEARQRQAQRGAEQPAKAAALQAERDEKLRRKSNRDREPVNQVGVDVAFGAAITKHAWSYAETTVSVYV